MKKILTTLLIVVFIFMVTSCDMNQNGKYLVEFITNTDSKITNQIVEKNEKIKKPIDPVKEGYILEGWYVGQDKWNFDVDVVTTNIKLEAKWKKEINYDYNTSVEIEFWHRLWVTNPQTAFLQSAIESFQNIYPNIKINESFYVTYDELNDAIEQGLENGKLPTVIETNSNNIAKFLDKNLISNLEDYIDSVTLITKKDETKEMVGLTTEEQNQYIKGFMDECRSFDSQNNLYALPFSKSTEVLYYNKTMFDKYGWSVPKTWDDVANISEKFRQTTECATLKNDGKAVAGFSYDSEANLFITLTQQWGGEYTKFDKNSKGVYAFNNNESKAAIRWYKEQSDKGNLKTTTFFGTNYSSDAFKAGQIVMTLGSSAGASYNVPSDGSFEVGVAAYPQKDLNNPQVIQQGTNVTLFKRQDAQEELAGWLFMKFLTNYESALDWCTSTSYFPIRKDVLNSDDYQNHISGKMVDGDGNIIYNHTLQNLALKVALEQRNWFFTNATFSDLDTALNETKNLVQNILYNNVDIDQAYENAIKNIYNNK